MEYVKISQLNTASRVNTIDFFPIVDSGSSILTTYRVSLEKVSSWALTNATASWALTASYADYALSASHALSSSLTDTASHLLWVSSRPFNGSASYAINAGYATTASYFDTSGVSTKFATHVLSASWASSSLSSSYVAGADVDGTVESASYALSASYAVSASYALSSSVSLSSSYALSSSYTVRFADSVIVKPTAVFGPFIADSTADTTTRTWGQWDAYQRNAAFILEKDADVTVKCIVNYTMRHNDQSRFNYLGVKLSPEGENQIDTATNEELDCIRFMGVPAAEGSDGYIDSYCELTFTKTNLSAGQYRVNVAPFRTTTYFSIWNSVSGSQDQVSSYEQFLGEQVVYERDLIRFPKFINALQVLVYSKEIVTQGIYPDPEVPITAIRRWWQLRYAVNSSTISNGQFEWTHAYESSLGGDEAEWIGPMGFPNQTFTLYKCLPSDMVIGATTFGPIGRILSGYPKITSTVCGEGTTDRPCGGYIDGIFVPCD